MKITHQKLLQNIPSGSACVFYNDSLIIVGDDATSLFSLSLPDYSYTPYLLSNKDSSVKRINKAEKHDFEAATSCTLGGENWLLAFGSGSVKEKRDSLLVASLENLNQQHYYSLEKLYTFLRQKSDTKEKDWNIEAAAVIEGFLVLFNRGDNKLIKIALSDFQTYINLGTLPETVIVKNINFGMKNAPQISGACVLKDGSILFTASMEKTISWYEDGEVMGSFIGLMDSEIDTITHLFPFENSNGERLKVKLESIEVIAENEHHIKAVSIADNDDGTTMLYQIDIEH